MSYDPRNDDFFSDWDFSAPDWLNDLEPKPEAPRQIKSDKNLLSDDTLSPPAKEPVTERQPAAEPDWQQEYIPRRSAKTPAPSSAGTRHTTAARRNPSRGGASWEQTRASSSHGRGRKQSMSVPVVILILLLVGGMIFAAWQLGSIFMNYSRDRSAYEDLANSAISGLAEAKDTTVAAATPDPNARPEPEEPVISEIPFTVDWEYLSSINGDIVGWLYCPNTVINYPVVQSSDHDFYLDHGFDGQSNTTGTLFVDRDSVSGIVQSNFIIYGHNMKDESMFGTFKHYADKSYYEAHPTLYYLTPGQCYRIDLICAHIVEATTENFPGYFASIDDYQTYLNRISSSAFWVNADAVTTEHQLLTMSTCTSAAGYRDPRLLVQGMMVPIQ